MSLRWRIAQFFEIRWWRHYLSGKEKTVYLDWKKNYWQEFLKQIEIELMPGGKVLDAGCGPAGVFMVLTHQKVDAVDPLLDEYCQKIPHFQAIDYPNTRFFCQAIETYFPDYQYDIVFCLNAVNHVADLDGCFDRLAALTKPGGTLVLSVDAHNSPFLKRVFRLFPGDILHPHQHDLVEYKAMLTERGFSIQRSVLIKKEWIFGYWAILAKMK
ncbi:MAG: methyltransferase domain-containing protein [Phycisphaerae bacterium]|nr:methyltransferase domain-containing protein [Saprospiraceae bacterium]